LICRGCEGENVGTSLNGLKLTTVQVHSFIFLTDVTSTFLSDGSTLVLRNNVATIVQKPTSTEN
jgi:hypothetical protein